jgi:hypothetical protein
MKYRALLFHKKRTHGGKTGTVQARTIIIRKVICIKDYKGFDNYLEWPFLLLFSAMIPHSEKDSAFGKALWGFLIPDSMWCYQTRR